MGLLISEGLLSVEKLVENNSDRPDIYFRRDFHRGRSHSKTLGGLVPVGSSSLRSEFYFFLVILKHLAKSKVRYFDLSFVEDDILGFQVVVNYTLLLIALVEVL